ncbi:UNVERIFIED_ORG: putative membrane protein [Variovorax paradoxus]|nr:putative membrane protein [Variovorax paradoxus]
MVLSIQHLYILVGLILAITAVMTLADRQHPKRYTSALFWGLYSLVFLVGDKLPPAVVGVGAIAMAVIAGMRGVGAGKHNEPTPAQYEASAKRLGNKLFMPALAIPLVTVIGTVLMSKVKIGDAFLLDPKNTTLVSLGVGCVAALALACWLTRESPVQGMRESRRLTDALGWAVVLPQMLGMLGLVFSDAGVGKAVAYITTSYINMDIRFVAVAVYVLGMALFTIIMGNGFAAFPVMTGGVGVPVLVGVYHGDPAVMAAIGMFSGYCGTLMTPMAANFNIVPAALLELPDKNAVIRVQIPTAAALLVVNIFLMYFLMFR